MHAKYKYFPDDNISIDLKFDPENTHGLTEDEYATVLMYTKSLYNSFSQNDFSQSISFAEHLANITQTLSCDYIPGFFEYHCDQILYSIIKNNETYNLGLRLYTNITSLKLNLINTLLFSDDFLKSLIRLNSEFNPHLILAITNICSDCTPLQRQLVQNLFPLPAIEQLFANGFDRIRLVNLLRLYLRSPPDINYVDQSLSLIFKYSNENTLIPTLWVIYSLINNNFLNNDFVIKYQIPLLLEQSIHLNIIEAHYVACFCISKLPNMHQYDCPRFVYFLEQSIPDTRCNMAALALASVLEVQPPLALSLSQDEHFLQLMHLFPMKSAQTKQSLGSVFIVLAKYGDLSHLLQTVDGIDIFFIFRSLYDMDYENVINGILAILDRSSVSGCFQIVAQRFSQAFVGVDFENWEELSEELAIFTQKYGYLIQ